MATSETKKEVIYPVDITSWEQKIKYSNDIREKISQEYVVKKAELVDGKITQEEFDVYDVNNTANLNIINVEISAIKQAPPQEMLDVIELDADILDTILFPITATTHEAQLSFSVASREKLRRTHNQWGGSL